MIRKQYVPHELLVQVTSSLFKLNNKSELMSNLKDKKIVLIHSIIWAALMLVLAYLIMGTDKANIIFIFMVAGWYISHSIILKLTKAKEPSEESKSKICCL